jgi:hypothetical protein
MDIMQYSATAHAANNSINALAEVSGEEVISSLSADPHTNFHSLPQNKIKYNIIKYSAGNFTYSNTTSSFV